jgi:hypothetical protein
MTEANAFNSSVCQRNKRGAIEQLDMRHDYLIKKHGKTPRAQNIYSASCSLLPGVFWYLHGEAEIDPVDTVSNPKRKSSRNPIIWNDDQL